MVDDIRNNPGVESVRINREHVALAPGIARPGVGIGVAEVQAAKRVELRLFSDRYPRIEKRRQIIQLRVSEFLAVGWEGGCKCRAVRSPFSGVIDGEVCKTCIPDMNAVVSAALEFLAVIIAVGAVLG